MISWGLSIQHVIQIMDIGMDIHEHVHASCYCMLDSKHGYGLYQEYSCFYQVSHCQTIGSV